MRKKYFLLMLLLFCLCFAIFSNNIIKADDDSNIKENNFINSIKDQAIKDYSKYNILPSVTIAQAILESSWGNSELTKNSNNLFGIKSNETWQGKTVVFPTKEYVDNVSITIYASFKSYNSYSESIEDHSMLLNEGRYEAVRNSSNYIDACYSLYNCGYATNPKYSELLIKIIQCFNLDTYDNFAKDQKILNDSYKNYCSKGIILSNKLLNTNINSKLSNNYTSSKSKEMKCKNKREKGKEDTNNIPKEIISNTCYNCNYWYVIYCLLQNYYPNIF